MFQYAIQKVSKSIFPIFQNGPAGCKVLGTGFFIDEEGHFLTAAHVINALAPGQSLGYLGNIPDTPFKGKEFIDIRIISIDKAKDLAIGKIEEEILSPLTLSSQKASIGESIVLCGYPMPMIHLTEKKVDPNTKKTKVSLNVTAVRKYWQPTIKLDEFKPKFILNKEFRSFITQHAALPGMSGGPIFNQDARVIGLTSAVWPRKIPLNKSQAIDISNGIGIELNEIIQFVDSVLRTEIPS